MKCVNGMKPVYGVDGLLNVLASLKVLITPLGANRPFGYTCFFIYKGEVKMVRLKSTLYTFCPNSSLKLKSQVSILQLTLQPNSKLKLKQFKTKI